MSMALVGNFMERNQALMVRPRHNSKRNEYRAAHCMLSLGYLFLGKHMISIKQNTFILSHYNLAPSW